MSKQIAEKSTRRSPVEVATWSHGGHLDWWVKERQQWLGRARGVTGKQRWLKADDLRPASGW
jgi:hypothetical protein